MSTAFSLSKCNNCITVVKEKAFAAKVVCEYELYQTKAQTQICIFVQKVKKQPKTSQKWLVFSCFLVEAAGFSP
jgi:hypothetical protein